MTKEYQLPRNEGEAESDYRLRIACEIQDRARGADEDIVVFTDIGRFASSPVPAPNPRWH